MARRTKAEAQATRTTLLDAAEQLFQSQGVSRTSLQDIASAAGVTRGAVYWHFKDKAHVFNAMMERVRLPMEEAAAHLEACEGREPLQRLRELLIAALTRVATDARAHRVYDIALHKVEYVDELVVLQQRHRQAVNEHVATIGRCLQRAGLAEGHALGLHALMVGLIHTWMLSPGSFDLVAEGRVAIDAQFAGLQCNQAPATPTPTHDTPRSRPETHLAVRPRRQ